VDRKQAWQALVARIAQEWSRRRSRGHGPAERRRQRCPWLGVAGSLGSRHGLSHDARALRLAPESTDIVGGVDSSVGRFLRGQNGVGGALVRAGVPAGGQARVGCRPSLRRGRRAAGWGSRCAGRRGQSGGATTPGIGGHDLHDPRRPGEAEGGVHAAAGRCSRARTWPSRSA
jgi:hypothetical protein